MIWELARRTEISAYRDWIQVVKFTQQGLLDTDLLCPSHINTCFPAVLLLTISKTACLRQDSLQIKHYISVSILDTNALLSPCPASQFLLTFQLFSKTLSLSTRKRHVWWSRESSQLSEYRRYLVPNRLRLKHPSSNYWGFKSNKLPLFSLHHGKL